MHYFLIFRIYFVIDPFGQQQQDSDVGLIVRSTTPSSAVNGHSIHYELQASISRHDARVASQPTYTPHAVSETKKLRSLSPDYAPPTTVVFARCHGSRESQSIRHTPTVLLGPRNGERHTLTMTAFQRTQAQTF